jgi:hypothetical protein
MHVFFQMLLRLEGPAGRLAALFEKDLKTLTQTLCKLEDSQQKMQLIQVKKVPGSLNKKKTPSSVQQQMAPFSIFFV